MATPYSTYQQFSIDPDDGTTPDSAELFHTGIDNLIGSDADWNVGTLETESSGTTLFKYFVIKHDSNTEIMFVIGVGSTADGSNMILSDNRWDIYNSTTDRTFYVAVNWNATPGADFTNQVYTNSRAPNNIAWAHPTNATKFFRGIPYWYENAPSMNFTALEGSSSSVFYFSIVSEWGSSTYSDDFSTLLISNNLYDGSLRPSSDRWANHGGILSLISGTGNSWSRGDGIFQADGTPVYLQSMPLADFWTLDAFGAHEPINSEYNIQDVVIKYDSIKGRFNPNVLKIGSTALPNGKMRDSGNYVCGPTPFLSGWMNAIGHLIP